MVARREPIVKWSAHVHRGDSSQTSLKRDSAFPVQCREAVRGEWSGVPPGVVPRKWLPPGVIARSGMLGRSFSVPCRVGMALTQHKVSVREGHIRGAEPVRARAEAQRVGQRHKESLRRMNRCCSTL